MDKKKASIIKAIAMAKVMPALNTEYLKTAVKALQWERSQTTDKSVSSLYQAFEEDVKRFTDGIPSAIIDNYTMYNILYIHFAIRSPLAYSINKGKENAFSHYINYLRHIIEMNDDKHIAKVQEAIYESEQQIKELREDMESLKGYDTSAIRLESHSSDNRLLQFMGKIENHEDNIAVNRMYIVLMQERKKQKQAFINSLEREDRCLLLDYINDKNNRYTDVERIIKDNINYWSNSMHPDKVR